MHNKLKELKRILVECGRVSVAFSSGVDSTFLLKVARDTLGKENVIAMTVDSCFIPRKEIKEAEEFCRQQDINLNVISVDVLKLDEVKSNPVDRCYFCKKNIFTQIKEASTGYVVCEGSNVDDMSDYRPGMRAINELSVRSPLKEAGLTKADIRALSKELLLNTWNKPSMACLASRIAYNEEITSTKLSKVEMAEDYLEELGFSKYRVRIHGEENKLLARIELSEDDMNTVFSNRALIGSINDKLKEIGFSYIALDMGGYRVGSMNEVINK